MLQAFSCDAITGAIVDEVPVSAFTWARLLSARGDGSVSVPLDGSFSKAALRDLLLHWGRIVRLDRDGVTQYGGYVIGRPYEVGSSSVGVQLGDLWALTARRGAWDHNAPNVEVWKGTVTGSLAFQAAQALLRGRTGPALPDMRIPVTIPGFGGTAVTRTYYGYDLDFVGDVHADLMDEGLDIYFQPRNIGNGDFDWLMNAGPAWSSGVSREFHVTSDDVVTGFSESSDGARITNNARYVGEGSEVDMLVRSDRNVASAYPLLDRVSDRKNIKDVSQLAALADQDLVAYESQTTQWDFNVTASTSIDVGDVVRLWFDGDPWIADGFHDRRVVKVTGDLSDRITVSCQPTGGA
jgi:hypothetical protein